MGLTKPQENDIYHCNEAVTAPKLVLYIKRVVVIPCCRKTERPDDGDAKVEDDDEVKKDEGSESGQDTMKAEEADVRDVKYQFENLVGKINTFLFQINLPSPFCGKCYFSWAGLLAYLFVPLGLEGKSSR